MSQVLDIPGYECIKDMALPTGIWRMEDVEPDRASSALAYAINGNVDDIREFAHVACLKYPHIGFKTNLPHRVIQQTSGTTINWGSAVWLNSASQSVVFTRPNAWDKDHMYHVGRFGPIPSRISYVGLQTVTVEDSAWFPRERFQYEVSGLYVNVYCSDPLHPCRQWSVECGEDLKEDLQNRSPTTFEVVIGNDHFQLKFDAPVCKTCFGLHDNDSCPFSHLPRRASRLGESHDYDSDGDSMMTPVDSDGESSRNPLSTGIEAYLGNNRGVILQRTDLVQEVITYVKKKHFLLIEAPPCSGKTTLLNHILTHVKKFHPKHTIDLLQLKLSSSFEPKPLVNHSGPPISNASELSCYVNNLSNPFWLFIDDAQKLYSSSHDDLLWDVLFKVWKPNFYVVAAGCYGSHTSSLSHCPPSNIIPTEQRISLFKSPESPLAIAFTCSHFQRFMALPQHQSWSETWKQCIEKYASPCDTAPHVTPDMELGLHPGVVAQMAYFITHEEHKSVDEDVMKRRFYQDCLADTMRPHPRGLGRCIPRLPTHDYGFTPAALLVFATVLKYGCITVSGIDAAIPSVVVSNAHPHLSKQAQLLRWDQVKPTHFFCHVNARTFNQSPTFQHVKQFLNDGTIATTPLQRFLNVVPGVDALEWGIKPFALRQMAATDLHLTDFEQAAHDARQMGWLLQLPSQTLPITLVLPSQWHRDYLEWLLNPKKVPPDVKEMTFDQFLFSVIRQFRVSVLKDYISHEEVLREKIYDSEFLRAASKVAEDPCFLLPQAQTKAGGFVDFVVREKRWVIELMREGNDVQGHINRFLPGGKYAQEWENWEWRVIDFRYQTKSIKERGAGYRTVTLASKAMFMLATMSGADLEKEYAATMTLTG